MHDLEMSYILSIVTQLLNDHLKIRTYLSDPRASQVVQWCRKNSPANAGDTGDMGLSPGSGRSLGKGMATHSSILAWRIPWTEEPGGLQFMGSLRVEHMTEQLTHTHTHTQCLVLSTQ